MSETETPMVIVGVAASAGGLEATSLLVQNLPKGLHCAFVLAQHMSPSHKSMLVQLLSRETSLAVAELESHTAPQPGTIYVPPPGFDVVYENGGLELRDPDGHPAQPKPSANRLFKSIAQELGEHSMGIVLSGTGSDGSYGVQAIREEGGITIAQEPTSSKYDSMPISAIRTGCVDLTLPPHKIGQHLAQILKRPRDLSSLKSTSDKGSQNSDLFQILLAHTLVDFRHYKESTINRRIHRRMIAKGIENYQEYLELCRRSVEEVEALYRDLLISVTCFFRDPDHFRELARVIREKWAKDDKEQLRIWVAGCATGEEAYTIAILIVEALGGLSKVDGDRLQIFATDIDERALAVGRKGLYPASALNDIPEDYLGYFEMADEHIQVKAKLRSFVMFTRHNVFQDAPFMAIDLVSIRNVLIYFEPKLQERVLTRIQYALKPEGLLFLGTSETTGVLESYFVPTQQHSKIFRKSSTRLGTVPTPDGSMPVAGARAGGVRAGYRGAVPSGVDDWARFDALARAMVANGILTNRDKTVLKIYGDLAPFIAMTQPVMGHMTLNVLKKPLAYEANSMILVALKHREIRSGQWHEVDGREFNTVRMTAYPIVIGEDSEPLVLIKFETEMRAPPAPKEEHEKSDYVDYLEGELSRTRDTLQVTIEQLQTANEELQSLNEEMQSANEELQATNEELETSNEELQSTNEELITVNEELLVNTSQLERTSAELSGLIKGLPTVMMMLDQGLLIRHASQSAMRAFRIRERGVTPVHLSQCHFPPNYPSLVDLCSQALVDRRAYRQQFETGDRVMSLAVTPLNPGGEDLLGLIVLIDSVDVKMDAVLNRTLRQFGKIGTWVMRLSTGRLEWSEETFSILGMSPSRGEPSVDKAIDCYVEEDRDAVRETLDRCRAEGGSFQFVARIRRPDGQIVAVQSSGAAVTDEMGEVVAIAGVFRDYSRMRNEDLLIKHFNALAAQEGIGYFSYDLHNDLPYLSPAAFTLLGLPAQTPAGLQAILSPLPEETRKPLEAAFDAARASGTGFDIDLPAPPGSEAGARLHVSCQVEKVSPDDVAYLYGSFQKAKR